MKLPVHSSDELLVRSRYDKHTYKITISDYRKIVETIQQYHDAIYFLPDFETIQATGLDKDIKGQQTTLRLNELMFV